MTFLSRHWCCGFVHLKAIWATGAFAAGPRDASPPERATGYALDHTQMHLIPYWRIAKARVRAPLLAFGRPAGAGERCQLSRALHKAQHVLRPGGGQHDTHQLLTTACRNPADRSRQQCGHGSRVYTLFTGPLGAQVAREAAAHHCIRTQPQGLPYASAAVSEQLAWRCVRACCTCGGAQRSSMRPCAFIRSPHQTLSWTRCVVKDGLAGGVADHEFGPRVGASLVFVTPCRLPLTDYL
jgi:hypothetical protein